MRVAHTRVSAWAKPYRVRHVYSIYIVVYTHSPGDDILAGYTRDGRLCVCFHKAAKKKKKKKNLKKSFDKI